MKTVNRIAAFLLPLTNTWIVIGILFPIGARFVWGFDFLARYFPGAPITIGVIAFISIALVLPASMIFYGDKYEEFVEKPGVGRAISFAEDKFFLGTINADIGPLRKIAGYAYVIFRIGLLVGWAITLTYISMFLSYRGH